MTSKPQIGRNLYNDALRRGRLNTRVIREALRRIVDTEPGPQTMAILVTKMALSVGSLEAVLSELDEIGRTAKDLNQGE